VVVLPRGEHSMPSQSTSLMERWRSGSSCDCGGWDLGCGLEVLSSSPDKPQSDKDDDHDDDSPVSWTIFAASQVNYRIYKLAPIFSSQIINASQH
jgi:hypothetical protein